MKHRLERAGKGLYALVLPRPIVDRACAHIEYGEEVTNDVDGSGANTEEVERVAMGNLSNTEQADEVEDLSDNEQVDEMEDISDPEQVDGVEDFSDPEQVDGVEDFLTLNRLMEWKIF
ncbi:hypothetical protein EMCRGX_G021994 [Ephydatia muelleri]